MARPPPQGRSKRGAFGVRCCGGTGKGRPRVRGAQPARWVACTNLRQRPRRLARQPLVPLLPSAFGSHASADALLPTMTLACNHPRRASGCEHPAPRPRAKARHRPRRIHARTGTLRNGLRRAKVCPGAALRACSGADFLGRMRQGWRHQRAQWMLGESSHPLRGRRGREHPQRGIRRGACSRQASRTRGGRGRDRALRTSLGTRARCVARAQGGERAGV
mmetsp:Transcript_12223/g.24658  ORF Transcript_12223/g.24658 Transcript_12223/m.24658 type:complete len:220 (-) Transcript_12223:318-977(-)